MRRAAWLLLLLAAPVVAGDTEQHYNHIRLQAERIEQVGNDTMHVSLNSYAEHQDAAQLAAQLNADMEWALQQVGMYKNIQARTGSYQTWPVNRDKILTKGWRGQQNLELESTDIKALSQLAGELQKRLKINSMRFSVSDGAREAAENRLIDAALNAFKERARIIRVNLKASGYRIVDLNVGTSASQPPMRYRSDAMVASMAEKSVATEAGESDIRVNVNGTIELVVPPGEEVVPLTPVAPVAPVTPAVP